MNKDTVIASIIGFSLGLAAAIAVWILPRALPKTASPQSSNQNQAEQTSGEVAGSNNATNIDLLGPKDGEIAKDNEINLTGKTAADNLVTVVSPTSSGVIKPEPDGSFSTKITLSEGANQIVITTLSDTQTQSKTITVYYLNQEI